ncbi:hypothetical protein AXG93_2278s1260 [Marchantia polymorpha subsp. ruderalis]|uniref:Inner centromere protein ARK-binding domain-containing protein n=1 Tax=Marchantia polymorpha subsp. ruderalis TaxID=1480154 RepID=A0A176WFZ7_MARPO|nr:hypothetical protein AXG93_2278s1260 [Marchantia polymorpha subsp. ruderalis]
MDPSWMEVVLDSIKNYQLQTKQLFEQQEALLLQRCNEITSTNRPAKRRKASKQCYGVEGKENFFTGSTSQKQQSNFKRIDVSGRHLQRLVNSSKEERVSKPCLGTESKEIDEKNPEIEMVGSEQLQEALDERSVEKEGQLNNVELRHVESPNEVLSAPSPCLEIRSKSPPKLIPGRGRKRGCVAEKAGELSVTTDALESQDDPPGVGRSAKTDDEPQAPRPVAAPAPMRMTRARAKLLDKCDGSVVDAQPKGKKPKGQKGRVKVLPQEISARKADDIGVQTIDEKVTRTEQIPDVVSRQAEGSEDAGREHMNQIQDVGAAAPVKEPGVQKVRSKAMFEDTDAIVRIDVPLNPKSNLLSQEELQSGHETKKDDVERQVGGEDLVRNEHRNQEKDVSQAASALEGQSVKKARTLMGRSKAVSETTPAISGDEISLRCDHYLQLQVENQLGHEGFQIDAERLSEGDDHLSNEHRKQDSQAAHTLRKKPVKKLRAQKGRSKVITTERTTSDSDDSSAGHLGSLHEQVGHERCEGDTDKQYGRARSVRNSHVKSVICEEGIVVIPQDQSVKKLTPQKGYAEAGSRSQADPVVYGAQDVRNETVIDSETGPMVTVPQSQMLETDGGLKRRRLGLKQKGSEKPLPEPYLSKVGDLTETSLYVHSAGEENMNTQIAQALDDQHNEDVGEAIIEATREDHDDCSLAELDSERWEDIKRSVKVRKGRGKAVSNFLGYADSDLFPLRSFDMALEQDRYEIENDVTPKEGLKGLMQTSRPFSDLLQKLDAADFASTQRSLQKESQMGAGRKDDGTHGRQSGAFSGEEFVPRNLNTCGELSANVGKERGIHDVNHEPLIYSGKESVSRNSVFGSFSEQGKVGIRGGASVTPKSSSQGPGPISESLEESAGAVVSGRGFRHLVSELKLELESTEPRRLDPELVIDLFQGNDSVNVRQTVQQSSCPLSGTNRARSNDGHQTVLARASTGKGNSTEWTVELTGGRKLVLEGDDKYFTQSIQTFADTQEMGQEDSTIPEAPEPNVDPELEEFSFVALEQVRIETEHQGGDASPVQEAGIKGIKLRIRPFSDFSDPQPSTQKKAGSSIFSLVKGEPRKSDVKQSMLLVASEEPTTLESPKSMNLDVVAMTPIRGKVDASNRNFPEKEDWRSTGTKSIAQMAAGGVPDLFKEVFTMKTPLRSQKRNWTKALGECQPMGRELSPPFHVREGRRSHKSASVNNRSSHSHKLRSSSPVEDHESGGSGVKNCSAAKLSCTTAAASPKVEVSGGELHHKRTNLVLTPNSNGNVPNTHTHHDVFSPVRVDLSNDLRRIVHEGQCRTGIYDSSRRDISYKSGNLGVLSQVVAVSPPSTFGQQSQPRGVVNEALNPPQPVSTEDCSGDTVVLSDDDQDTLTSKLKSVDSFRQGETCNLMVPSLPSSQPEVMLMSTHTLEDLNPLCGSSTYGVHRADSKLAVEDTRNRSEEKSCKLLEREIRSGGKEVEGDRITRSGHMSITKASGSGAFVESLERSKRTLQSPLCSERKKSRLSLADGSVKSLGLGRTSLHSGSSLREILPEDVAQVSGAESFHEAEDDAHSGSTKCGDDEDEGVASESNSNDGECEIADNSMSVSSFGKTCREETSTLKVSQSIDKPRTNSNILNPYAQSTRLLSNVRTLIPVSQRPAPNFIPNGKRDVKVKALEAAEAARRLQEKREMEKRERMQKRADAIARRAMEKEKAKEEFYKAELESKASQKALSDSNTVKDSSALAGKAVLTDCTNSKSLQSPKSKSTRALAVKTKMEQEKAKRLEEDLRKKEEERKKKEAEVLARKRKKEEAEKKEREEKRRRQEDMLKQRKEQEERLRAELEEKEHRHRVLEEAERERKALEEESRRQRRAEREKERERRQKEELELKAARQAEKEAERKRKEEAFLTYKASEEHDHRVGESIGAASRLRSQHSTGLSTEKLRSSNLLSSGASLSFSRPARVPSTAFDGRTHLMATPMVQNKGPTSALSAVKMQPLVTAGKSLEVDHGPKLFATPTLAAVKEGDPGPQSYEISPYRNSSDDDEDEERLPRPKKFIPAWASKENLMPQLLRQLTQDPDEIFAGTKTCSLKEVFGTNGSKKVLDFGRRSGSGDWVKDRVSWKEELQYKIDMGYMSHMH